MIVIITLRSASSWEWHRQAALIGREERTLAVGGDYIICFESYLALGNLGNDHTNHIAFVANILINVNVCKQILFLCLNARTRIFF